MDLKAQRLSSETLQKMSDKDLVDKYGEKFDAKRTVCREARDAVLTEFDGNSNTVN
jgi:hypothetical protein